MGLFKNRPGGCSTAKSSRPVFEETHLNTVSFTHGFLVLLFQKACIYLADAVFYV